jgi:bacterioferritin-associated ferredoxin
MVVCSCSVLTDSEIQEYLQKNNPEYMPSVKKVLESLGYTVVCASCSRSIKELIRNHYDDGDENVLCLGPEK